MRSIQQLQRLQEALIPEDSSDPDAPGPALDATSLSVDAWLTQLVTPHLRAWLDANLPALVEALVSQEIARLREETS
jgi:hypothetical protein